MENIEKKWMKTTGDWYENIEIDLVYNQWKAEYTFNYFLFQ